MNIYIKKKKTGIYNHKYISKVNFETKNSNDVIFEVKYHNLDDDNTKKYNKNPYFPAFIPIIPEDILDPLIYSEVDK